MTIISTFTKSLLKNKNCEFEFQYTRKTDSELARKLDFIKLAKLANDDDFAKSTKSTNQDDFAKSAILLRVANSTNQIHVFFLFVH